MCLEEGGGGDLSDVPFGMFGVHCFVSVVVPLKIQNVVSHRLSLSPCPIMYSLYHLCPANQFVCSKL